jgi:hypothetical protein
MVLRCRRCWHCINLVEAKKGATVAVKVTDMPGEEVLVVKQV